MLYKFFDDWFTGYNITELEKEQYINDIYSIIFPVIVLKAGEKLSADDKQKLKQFFKEKDFNKIIPFIEDRYSETEWSEFLDQHIAPILDSYRKEVLQLE